MNVFPHVFSFKFCICQAPRIARAYTAQNTKICALLACLAQPTYPIPARCGTGTAGREAFEPPPEDGARTKRLDREFQFRESHTEAETKKTPDRIKKQNEYIYLVYLLYCASRKQNNPSPGVYLWYRCYQGFSFFTGHPPARGSSEEVLRNSRVESGRVRRCSKPHGSARVELGGLRTSRAASGHPDSIRSVRSDPTRE